MNKREIVQRIKKGEDLKAIVQSDNSVLGTKFRLLSHYCEPLQPKENVFAVVIIKPEHEKKLIRGMGLDEYKERINMLKQLAGDYVSALESMGYTYPSKLPIWVEPLEAVKEVGGEHSQAYVYTRGPVIGLDLPDMSMEERMLYAIFGGATSKNVPMDKLANNMLHELTHWFTSHKNIVLEDQVLSKKRYCEWFSEGATQFFATMIGLRLLEEGKLQMFGSADSFMERMERSYHYEQTCVGLLCMALGKDTVIKSYVEKDFSPLEEKFCWKYSASSFDFVRLMKDGKLISDFILKKEGTEKILDYCETDAHVSNLIQLHFL